MSGPQWTSFESLTEYQAALAEREQQFSSRWQWGQLLQATCETAGSYSGYCGVCQRETDFTFSPTADGPINLREELACRHCGLNARVRAIVHLLSEATPPGTPASIYLTEQTTGLYQFVKARWPKVVGSEFFEESFRQRLSRHLRQLIGQGDALRREDVTALTFGDQCLDVIISCDVLEHVPDYRKALSEFGRVLRPGGRLLLTVPFMEQSYDTTVRARLKANGEIEHIEEPEYHGDPMDPDGVLAFYNFGWDLLDRVREAGFSEASWRVPWAPGEGLFPGLWTLHARR